MDSALKPLKDYAIEDIWELFPNKYEALVVLIKESRRLLLQFQIQEVELPGERALLTSLANYRDRKIKVLFEES